jgi:large subunit ribosomal protein L23
MNQERIYKVILGPHVTEKSSVGSEENRQYAFKVSVDSTKTEIKQAVEALFDVAVDSVRVINQKGKSTRFGRTLGRRKDWKKAYVRLSAGSEINVDVQA